VPHLTIAQVCRTSWPRTGGLEVAVGGLARALVARGHRVRIVTLRDPDHPEPVEGLELVRLRRIGPRRYPTALGLADAVRGADLVHVHGLDGLLDALVLRRSAPIGVSTHGGYFHTPRHRRLKQLWLRTVTRWSLERADAVWFSSRADREVLAPAGVPGGVMEDGVDLERFARVVRRPEPGLVVVVGRVDVHKGLDDLVDALPHAPAVRVEVVGPEHRPGLVDALVRRARDRGVADRVTFLGERSPEELAEALGRAERVALPSRFEGFGIAAVEAMAARVPVVLADIPAFRAHAGAARIVSFRDPVAAAGALTEPVPADRVERAAARAAIYAWPARAAAWEAEYLRVLGRAAGRE
jgi:alpha-1,3-mannosyltransferase